jgi:hypothetical protein
LAKPNYQFEKRQRELAKKKKKEEKIQQRRSGGPEGAPDAEHEGVEGTEGAVPDAESGSDDAGEAPQAEASA